jgi:Mrp family chromosome partitioning ATPase
MADAIEAAQLCDAVVMVCRLGKVSRSEVQQAVAGLSGVTVLGCIANCVESSIKGYGYTKYAQQTKAPEATTFQLLSKSLKRRN